MRPEPAAAASDADSDFCQSQLLGRFRGRPKTIKKKEEKKHKPQKMQHKHSGSLRALYKLEAETSEVQGPAN